MLLYFARHGESTANLLHVFSNRSLDHPLTGKGLAQAFELAERLAQTGVDALYTSPVPRAVETAQIVGERLHIEMVISDALREFDVGNFEGRSDDAAWVEFGELYEKWQVYGRLEERLPGGENYLEIRERFVPFINGLNEEYGSTNRKILLISHGGLYRLMLPVVIHNIPSGYADKHMLGNTDFVIAEWTDRGLMALEYAGKSLPRG